MLAEERVGIDDVVELAPLAPLPRERAKGERLACARIAVPEHELAAARGLELLHHRAELRPRGSGVVGVDVGPRRHADVPEGRLGAVRRVRPERDRNLVRRARVRRGNVSRSDAMISSAVLRSGEATDTLRWELQRLTCSKTRRARRARSRPPRVELRRRGSPSTSSESALVAQLSVRSSVSPAPSARSRKADATMPCCSSSCVSWTLGCQDRSWMILGRATRRCRSAPSGACPSSRRRSTSTR